MVTRTYLDKTNTIVKGNYCNLGINPIVELNYGKLLTRFLFYFDHNKIKKMVDDKTYPDLSKLKHFLKMTNCGSVDKKEYDKKNFTSDFNGVKERATSFDLIFFLLPKKWDEGRGFDFVEDLFIGGNKSLSVFGCNWFNSTTTEKWDEEGVFSTNTLSRELDKFSSKDGNKSKIIIGVQHFDYGNENINIDITETVNKFINGEIENNGIGVAFAPSLELMDEKCTQYVGFFSKHTNTFFEPFIETIYDETIEDDRNSFYLNKINRLYFYSNVNGIPTNLDNNPICTINDKVYESKQATKGVYYVEVDASDDSFEENTMYYDEWSQIILNGKNFGKHENQFVVKEASYFFNFISEDATPKRYFPSVRGILDMEKINRGDVRKIIIDARIPYTNIEQSINGMFYRLYVHDGVKELDIIPWQKTERSSNHNYFMIDTSQYLPNRYYVDIKICSNMEKINYQKVCSFDIVNNVTEIYT